MEFNDFVTLEYLGTYMGTVVVTMLTVQFTKELPVVKKCQQGIILFWWLFLI